MGTRRERLEAKLAKREEWAKCREEKAQACFDRQKPYIGDHAFNTQPGHIPERARVIRAMERGFEHQDMAKYHQEKAGGLADQLERTTFSDDPDAIEQLEAKIHKAEADAERMKLVNKIIRNHKENPGAASAALIAELGISQDLAAKLVVPSRFGDIGIPAYATTNLRANIRRMKARIDEIKRRNQRQEKAEEQGVVIIEGTEWVRITFAEKPDREILDSLKAAGFTWGGGSWTGKREKIPHMLG